MAYSRTSFTVQTNGQTLAISATAPTGSAGALHLTTAVSSAVTQPYTITSDTTFYVLDELAGDYVVSCKQPDGTELFGKAVKLQPGDPKVIAPLPSAAQVGADVAARGRLSLAPTGALAETFSRVGASFFNSATLSTGRMSMVAIDLPAGLTVTSITFASATTQAGTPTAQWFALYDSARGLLAQTVDDEDTAWAANSSKTLALTDPFTTTYSGLHYLAINVTAGTVPSLAGTTALAGVSGVAPIVSGTSTTGLTTTAPATAAALTSVATLPWAYVS